MKHPIASEYLEKIIKNYLTARTAKVSRFSVEWGKWSREMNIELRKLLMEEHVEKEALKAVYSVWISFSVLLELHFKYPSSYRKKREKREAIGVITDLKQFIHTGIYPEYFEKNYKIIDPNDFPLKDNELAKRNSH